MVEFVCILTIVPENGESGKRYFRATIIVMAFRRPLPYAVRNAQVLRKRCTPVEIALWEALRNRKFLGLKFRRQVPVGKFIVDFLCTHPKLIIELDGPIHDFKIQEDAWRSESIREDMNIPILRLKNEEVLKNLPKTLKTIEQFLLPRL